MVTLLNIKNFFIFVGVIVGIICYFMGWWDFVEPIMGLSTLSLVVYQLKLKEAAKKTIYSDNGDSQWVVGLQIGCDLAPAMISKFGHIDVMIDAKAVTGSHTLATENDYKALAKEAYKAIAAGAGKNTKVVLSGPVTLAFMVGQMCALHAHNVQLFNYVPTTNSYEALPKVTSDWKN